MAPRSDQVARSEADRAALWRKLDAPPFSTIPMSLVRAFQEIGPIVRGHVRAATLPRQKAGMKLYLELASLASRSPIGVPDREDCAQTVLRRMVQEGPRGVRLIDPTTDEGVRQWLRRALMNEWFSLLRQGRRWVPLEGSLPSPARFSQPASEVELIELRAVLYEDIVPTLAVREAVDDHHLRPRWIAADLGIAKPGSPDGYVDASQPNTAGGRADDEQTMPPVEHVKAGIEEEVGWMLAASTGRMTIDEIADLRGTKRNTLEKRWERTRKRLLIEVSRYEERGKIDREEALTLESIVEHDLRLKS